MKKYSILLAIVALVLASLACQTIMGGGETPFTPYEEDVPSDNFDSNDNGGSVPVPTPYLGGTDNGNDNENDNGAVGNSEFPMTNDAFNVFTAEGTLTYQTKMSSDDVMKFYRDQFDSMGYKEDSSMTVTFGSGFTLAFNGSDGKVVFVIGAGAGDGSTFISVTQQ